MKQVICKKKTPAYYENLFLQTVTIHNNKNSGL